MSGSLPQQCVILIGGLGTRLGSLTAEVPKPLLRVGGRPFLDYLIEDAARFGCSKILLLAGYRAENVSDYLRQGGIGDRLGVEIEMSREPEPLGTGGALKLGAGRLDSRFYMLNGDSWFGVDWRQLEPVAARGDRIAALALRRIPDARRFGVVELEGERISRFREHAENEGPALINSGVYLVRREIIDYLHPRCSLERDIFPILAARGRLAGLPLKGEFIDIGVPADFEEAQHLMAEWRRPLERF